MGSEAEYMNHKLNIRCSKRNELQKVRGPPMGRFKSLQITQIAQIAQIAQQSLSDPE